MKPRYVNESWTVRTQVNFNREFGKHRVSALAGNEVRRLTTTTINMQAVWATTPRQFVYSGEHQRLEDGIYNSDMMIGNDLSGSLNYGSYSLRDNRFVSWYFNGSYSMTIAT
ncbi:MAG: hypothetical protein ACLUVG_08515 [Phocaeicola vulgatus]